MRKKKSEKKKLADKLWEVVKVYIRLRDKNICQRSGEPVEGCNCHVSHVIPKSTGNVLRFDEMNLKVLSYHNHINWWHKNPLEAAEWFKEKFPERHEYLQRKKNEIVKFTVQDYKDMIEEYKSKIDKLNQS